MEPLMAYAGNNLMNMVAGKVYVTQRNKFRVSGTSSGVSYTFDVTDAPVAKLVVNVASHNLEFDLKKVAISAKGSLIDSQKTLQMKATGRLPIAQDKLSLTGLKVTTTSSGAVDQVVAGIINAQVLPETFAKSPTLSHPFAIGQADAVCRFGHYCSAIKPPRSACSSGRRCRRRSNAAARAREGRRPCFSRDR